MPTYQSLPVDFVLDVRSRLEFWLGHLEGAECLPLQRLATAIHSRPEIGKDARILVYCASGARSAAASAILRDLGYRRVVDAGGMSQAARHFVP